MTTAADDYVNRVLARLPRAMSRRAQIAAELRGHIAERVADGRPLADVLGQLGEPNALAESYLAAEPMVAAPLGRRLLAKLTDIAIVLVAGLALSATIVLIFSSSLKAFEQLWVTAWLAFVFSMIVSTVLFGVYTIVAEWRYGWTLGKRAFDLIVVRESGTQIGLGQSIVRQLPAMLQVYWIDAFFVFFTDRRQRAFELLSKTRVVLARES